jgi:hypothetical protein
MTEDMMLWYRVRRVDSRARALADRHYSRQTIGAREFTPPARTLVFITANADAVWATSWPRSEYVKRELFPSAWVCSIFRNESPSLSSELIRQAVAATRAIYPVPSDGMVTMVDAS